MNARAIANDYPATMQCSIQKTSCFPFRATSTDDHMSIIQAIFRSFQRVFRSCQRCSARFSVFPLVSAVLRSFQRFPLIV